MRNSRLYLALFAILIIFNGNMAVRMLKQPITTTDTTSTTTTDVAADVTPVLTEEELAIQQANSDLLADRLAAFNAESSVSADSQPLAVGLDLGHPVKTVKIIEFFKMEDGKKCFSDVGVSSEGIIIGVGLGDDEIYEYNLPEDKFVAIKTDIHISNKWRVDINYDGVIYFITRCGDTYYIDCERRVVKLPGCAIDIGAGRQGDVYKLGCEHNDKCKLPTLPGDNDRHKPSSPHVYKLICSCTCKCCDRRCKVFIKKYHHEICEPAEKKICYWARLPNDIFKRGKLVEFTRIDVNLEGEAITTDGEDNIYAFVGKDENKFKKIFDAPRGTKDINDIAACNNGSILFITDDATYIVKSENSAEKIKETKFNTSLGGTDISCGPYELGTLIHRKLMYTLARPNYSS